MKIFIDKVNGEMSVTAGTKTFGAKDIQEIYNKIYNLHMDPNEVYSALGFQEDFVQIAEFFNSKDDATIQIEFTII